MKVAELLSRLHALGISLWVADERLHYSAPRGTLTPDLREALTEHKAEILVLLRGISADAGRAALPIRPAARGRELPLSFAQERLWFLDQLAPGSPFYNTPATVWLKGQLDVSALRRTMNEIVRRHEVLRTTFRVMNGRPVQVIAPPLQIRLPIVDLEDLPDLVRQPETQRLANEEAQRPFDLARGPVQRAVLLRLSKKDHVLLLTLHHIVSDGWSIGVLMREMEALYQAFSRDEPSPLPEPPIQYADYAIWQREWLQSQVLKDQIAYWKQQLGGSPPVLELPTDRPRPPAQTFRGVTVSLTLPGALTEKLKALSQQAEATLFMTLLAGFQVLLYRHTGQEDIVVGTPVANRNQRETEELIGSFANTLVLRCDVSGNPTFRELLGRVREVALGAYAHQDMPFEVLVEKLQPERDLSRNPLFQTLFALHNLPEPSFKLPGLTLSSTVLSRGTARFDLVFELWEREGGLVGHWEYSTDLFESATIARIANRLQVLLESIVADPEQRIAALPLLTEKERQQLLAVWNDTQTNYWRPRCLHDLFATQAERVPDATALVCEGNHLTYRSLDRRANQLAHYLMGHGVSTETLVGIYMERSLETIVSMLGILKAGGAFVPFDPTYPRERLTFMLADTQTPILLSQSSLFIESPSQVACVRLDSDWDAIAQANEEPPPAAATPDNPAYVIYTSGSTGRPKGVQICHRSIAHLVETAPSTLGLAESDIWTVFHSYAFDFSMWETWVPLTYGGKIVVVPYRVTLAAEELDALLQEERITILNQTPSSIRQLAHIKAAMGHENGALRIVCCGGEALPQDLAVQLLEWGIPVWNLYGPTEATVWASIGQVEVVETISGTFPIGRPLPDIRLYVLDADLQPAPIGVPGELYIGGGELARGYLNHPELTAAKFVPDPFALAFRPKGKRDAGAGARLYRTGDLVRFLPDSRLEFLRRVDHQVKVNGFRVELGEIEAALDQHPAVREAVVVVREDGGHTRLVAYIVPHSNQTPTTSELRDFLRAHLPNYMVPSVFVLLESLPLTPTQKVDRRALPAPDGSRPDLGEPYVAPQTELERIIAAVWQEVLHVDKVGIYDNLFDLGGHSLLIIQVHGKLQEAISKKLSVIDMFRYPTVSSLANHLSEARDAPPSFQESYSRAQKQREAINSQRQRIRKSKDLSRVQQDGY